MLNISLLTPFALQQDGQPITLTSRRTEALFVYLFRTGQPQSRDALANLFWDDLPQTQAAGNLRVLISNLHKAVGPHVIITRQSVAFDHASAFHCDLTVLEKGLATTRNEQTGEGGLSKVTANNLAQALAGFQGELLPGFYLRGGQRFDEWLATERERLWTRAVQALSDLASTYLRLGDHRAGIEQAQRLVKLDPLREDGHQQLMQLLAADGQTNAALTHYQRCVEILAAELGVPPSPATTQLFEQIQRGEWRQPVPLVVSSIAHNLPRPMMPFVGREAELARLAQLLHAPATPLITVVGDGGMGKTALALEAARHQLDDAQTSYRDGIFLVPLAAISEVAAMPVAIAAAIGYAFQKEGGDERAQLLAHLRHQSLLLLLDNFEHLLFNNDLDDFNDFLNALLQAAPQLRLLITSRHKLNCASESVLLLDGMALPTEHALQSSAVQLFVQSVQRAHGSHEFSTNDLAVIARICHLVQGMPLAILLAASWVETHTFAEIAAEIAQNVGFLATAQSDLPERQRSMHAVFEYSWQLLSNDEQRVFARMSIFRAGCTRPVALFVTGGSSQHLLALEHKSRIQRDLSSGRYSIHELLRQLAALKLMSMGEMGESAAPLHVRAIEGIEQHYAADLAPHAGELAYHAEQAGLIDKACRYLRLAAERAQKVYQNSLALDTYSRALALTPPDDKEAQFQMRMARHELYHLLGNREQQASELAVLHVLAIALDDLGKQCEVFLCQARYAEALGQYADAASAAQAAVALAERLESVEHMARANLAWGVALRRENLFDLAQTRLNAAVMYAEQATLPQIAADGLRNLGIIAAYQGDYLRAHDYFEKNLRIYQQLGNLPSEAAALGNLGVLAIYQSDYAAAQPYLEQSVAIFRRIGDRRSEAIALNNLGTIAHKQNDIAKAQACFEQTIQISHQINDLQSRREAHNLWAHLLVDEVKVVDAKRHYETALQLAHEIYASGSVVESQAGLAGIAFAEGNSAGAFSLVQEFLGDVNERALAQTEDPLRIYLTCYRILCACHDERASQLIETAYRILQARAAKTPNAAIHASFLQRIPVHRQIVAEFSFVR